MKTVHRNSLIIIAIMLGIIVAAFGSVFFAQRWTTPTETVAFENIGLTGNEGLIHFNSYNIADSDPDQLLRASGEVVLEANIITPLYTPTGDLYLVVSDISDSDFKEYESIDVYRVFENEIEAVELPTEFTHPHFEMRFSDQHGVMILDEIEEKIHVRLLGGEWQEIATDFLPDEYVQDAKNTHNKRVAWSESDQPVIEFSYERSGDKPPTSDTPRAERTGFSFMYTVVDGTVEEVEYTGNGIEFSKPTHYYDDFPHYVCASIFRSPDDVYFMRDYRYSQCIGTYYDQWDIKVNTPVIGRQSVRLSAAGEGEYDNLLSWPAIVSNRKVSAQALNADATHMLVQVDEQPGILNARTGEYAYFPHTLDPSWTDMFQLRVLSTPVK